MKNQTITFSPDFRESKFELTMEQLHWDGSVNETRPKIVWPAEPERDQFRPPRMVRTGTGINHLSFSIQRLNFIHGGKR